MLGCFQSPIVEVVPIPTSYRRLVPKQVERSGILVNEYVYEDCDTSLDGMDIYSVDFSLGNIVRTGSVSLLKPIVMTTTSAFGFIDSFENLHIKTPEPNE